MRTYRLHVVLTAAVVGSLSICASASQETLPTPEDLLDRAGAISRAIEPEGLSDETGEQLAELAELCRLAGGGYFPGAAQLREAGSAEDALAALKVIVENLEEVRYQAVAVADSPGAYPGVSLARAELEEIFSAGNYQLVASPPSAASRVMARISRALDRFLDRLVPSQDAVELVARSYLAIVLVIISSIMAFLICWLVKQCCRRTSQSSGASHEAIIVFDSAAEHTRQADLHFAAGRYKQALRETFLALLAELEALKVAARDRSRTNREYIAQVARHSRDAETPKVMATAVKLYEYKWYGRSECSAEDIRALREHRRAVIERVVK